MRGPLQVLEDRLREQGRPPATPRSPSRSPSRRPGRDPLIGQLSTLYGGIEDLVVGLEAVLPDGTVTRIKNVPRRAAGPDVRHLVIGNEGALCFVTEVTVEGVPAPPGEQRFHGYLVDDVAAGVAVLREVVAEGYRPSVARLYSPTTRPSTSPRCPRAAGCWSFVAEGPRRVAEATSAGIEDVVAAGTARRGRPGLVEAWFEGLNWGQDKIDAERASMLATSRLGYTTEVSCSWSQVAELYESVMRRINRRTRSPTT